MQVEPPSRSDASGSRRVGHQQGGQPQQISERVVRSWIRRLDAFIPQAVHELGGEELRRSRLLLGVTSVCVAIPLTTFVLQIWRGGTPAFMSVGIGTAIASTCLMLLMRFTGSYRLVGHLVVGLLFSITGFIVASAGGAAPIGFFGASMVPLVAVLLCGVRAGVGWSALTLANMAAVMWARSAGMTFPVEMDAEIRTRWTFLGGMLITSGSLLVASVYESLRERALRDLEAARERAEAEHIARLKTEQLFRDRLEEQVEARTRELDSSRQQLRHAERLASIGTLAAGIAHQINNPVGSILASAQWALQCGDDERSEEIAQESLQEVVAQAKRCGRIVHSILRFSRDEPTEKWTENLNEVVQRSCELTRSYADQCGASVHFESSHDDIPVRMNPIEIEQVVVNLVRNAIESGTNGVSVHVETLCDERSAWIRVEDDGAGIEPELLERAFDPFLTTRLEQGGSGLGLSVAHGIIGDHGGRVRIESGVGEGTTVSVELPLASSLARNSTTEPGTPTSS